jgi:hypothetical protein
MSALACVTPQPRSQGEIPIDKRRPKLSRVPHFTTAPQYCRFLAVKVASIPFRFKAGGSGNMAPVSVESHHHRSTTKRDKKGFKARHATKGSLKEQSKGTFSAQSSRDDN